MNNEQQHAAIIFLFFFSLLWWWWGKGVVCWTGGWVQLLLFCIAAD
jgi:hypothetical protein